MTANSWSAVAAIAQGLTVLVAGWALIYARGQVREARETRERTAQPDVVVFIEHNEIDWHHMDLVVKNFGQTTAYNIEITLPNLELAPYENVTTGQRVTHLDYPKNLAVLAPGQQWRTIWESGHRYSKYKSKLKTNYVGNVNFDDRMVPVKPSYQNPISLDTKIFWNTMQLRSTTDNARDSANALEEISKTLKGYKSPHGGIWVYVVPGDAERQYYRDIEQHLKDREEYYKPKDD
jgi:hypothetical protein